MLRDGKHFDFLADVIAAHGAGHWDYRYVPGELVLEYVAEAVMA